jgi:N6-adenosine-specific RNA methylase IME4
MPETRYRTIVADPPWEYDEGFPSGIVSTSGEVKRWTYHLPYPSMTLEEIKALPVADVADRNARLFLWTTNKYLSSSFEVVASWGFQYAQTVVWEKTSHIAPFVTSIAPQATEYLLYAHRGKPAEREGAFPSTVIRANRSETHSKKPEAFMDYIEEIGEPPRLEMFSRRARFGWDTWGDEALGHVSLEAV